MSPIWPRAARKPDDVVTMSNTTTPAARPAESTEPPAGPPKILLVATPLALAALSAAVIFTGFGLGYWTTLGPGPGFFPFWIGLLMGISSLVWLLQALRGNPNVLPQPEEPVMLDTDTVRTAPTAKKRPIWTVLLSLVILASLLELIGFQLSMFAFLLFQLKFQGGRKWLSSLIIALVGSFGVFYLFTEVLQVTLPTSSINVLEDLGL